MKNVKEEYFFESVESYLSEHVDLVIVGDNFIEDRCLAVQRYWLSKDKKTIIKIKYHPEHETVSISGINSSKPLQELFSNNFNIMELEFYLSTYIGDAKNILMDITSLSHPLIFYVTKLLIKNIKPFRLFASYAEPESYIETDDARNFKFSTQYLNSKSIPGFTRRIKDDVYKLIVFLGFEGPRLTSLFENLGIIDEVVPIIGSPSYNPRWFYDSMWSNKFELERITENIDLKKCKADSVFDAYNLLHSEVKESNKACVIAPFGTRVHSLACALYAIADNNVRIVYDNPVEAETRSIGLKHIKIYHLTSFIGRNL